MLHLFQKRAFLVNSLTVVQHSDSAKVVKMLNSSPTFLAISSLWGCLLGRAVSQQEKAKHQANLSDIHNTWKTLQIHCKETPFWGCATISSLQLRALARLFCGTSSEWMRKSYLREQMFYRCWTDECLCCFWNAEGRWMASRTVKSLLTLRQAWLSFHVCAGYQWITAGPYLCVYLY